MSRLKFAAILLATARSAAEAQRIPGRDLLEFPVGALAEAPALALETGDGFRNPASVLLPRTARARASVLSLITGNEQSVTAHSAVVAAAFPQRVTVALSASRAAVTGIVRTDTDPQSIAPDVSYHTLVVSALIAHQQNEQLTTGAAVRYRSGVFDGKTSATVGLDGGLVAERLFGYDVRAGLSTFLWNPGEGAREESSFTAALDGRVVQHDSTTYARAGYSYSYSERFAREHFFFASAHMDGWVARVGVARSTAFARTNTRLRLAVGLRYARYILGVAREDSPAGLSPTYQFMLSALVRS